jgi:hypothetical protein
LPRSSALSTRPRSTPGRSAAPPARGRRERAPWPMEVGIGGTRLRSFRAGWTVPPASFRAGVPATGVNFWATVLTVMAGLDPPTHAVVEKDRICFARQSLQRLEIKAFGKCCRIGGARRRRTAWVAGSSPAMTTAASRPESRPGCVPATNA